MNIARTTRRRVLCCVMLLMLVVIPASYAESVLPVITTCLVLIRQETVPPMTDVPF